MRAKEFITEVTQDKISKSARASTPGMVTTPAANNNAGDAYKSYRMGLALAGAPEFPTKAESEIGGDPLLSAYTDEEAEMIKYAVKQASAGPLKTLSRRGSEERTDTYKTSPTAKPKRNRYGV